MKLVIESILHMVTKGRNEATWRSILKKTKGRLCDQANFFSTLNIQKQMHSHFLHAYGPKNCRGIAPHNPWMNEKETKAMPYSFVTQSPRAWAAHAPPRDPPKEGADPAPQKPHKATTTTPETPSHPPPFGLGLHAPKPCSWSHMPPPRPCPRAKGRGHQGPPMHPFPCAEPEHSVLGWCGNNPGGLGWV